MENAAERPQVQLIRRTASDQAIHSQEYTSLKAQQAFTAKMAEARAIHEQLQRIPQAPAFKAKAKQVPTAPEKPQSLLMKHKKKLIYGGLGLGTLAIAGVAWHLATRDTSEEIEYA